MDTTNDLLRSLEVLGRDHDDSPPFCFEGFPPLAIALPLPGVALVLPTVVLDQDPEESIDEISARQENAIRIMDVDVDLGHGQTRELHHQSHVGLSRGFDVLTDEAERTPRPANAVEVGLHGELRQLVERRQAETHQPVAGTDQLDEGQLRGAVDERSIRPEQGDAVDEVGVKPPLTVMEKNAWESATEVCVRRELQRRRRTRLLLNDWGVIPESMASAIVNGRSRIDSGSGGMRMRHTVERGATRRHGSSPGCGHLSLIATPWIHILDGGGSG